eukprot:Rhum_TRINITY_DN21329_c0_g1::Rhum_TRINITY_DN21329_c0_g1_i1::g.173797::m.173797
MSRGWSPCVIAALALAFLEGHCASAQWYGTSLDDRLVGYYERRAVTDRWHRVFLTRAPDGFKWSNSAGRTWRVWLKSPPDVTLMNAADPYNTGKVVIAYTGSQDGPIKTITGPHTEPYWRAGDLYTCDSHTCTDTRLVKMSNDYARPCDSITNHATVGAAYVPYTVKPCEDSICCEAMCTPFSCPAGYKDKSGKSSIRCGSTFAECTLTKCCEVLCSHAGFACSAPNYKLKPSPNTITCGNRADVNDCNTAICCDAYCPNRLCQTGFKDKAGKADILCGPFAGSCTDGICCDVTCENTGYLCPVKYQDKTNPASITCGATVAECNEVKCCDALCGHHTCPAG